jgi:hypothetical protein
MTRDHECTCCFKGRASFSLFCRTCGQIVHSAMWSTTVQCRARHAVVRRAFLNSRCAPTSLHIRTLPGVHGVSLSSFSSASSPTMTNKGGGGKHVASQWVNDFDQQVLGHMSIPTSSSLSSAAAAEVRAAHVCVCKCRCACLRM